MVGATAINRLKAKGLDTLPELDGNGELFTTSCILTGVSAR
jgi:hypothetical protein